MTSSESTTERQLASEDRCRNNTSQFTSVVAGVSRVRATNAQHVEHGGLRFKNGATTEGADFNGWHGNAYLKVAPKTMRISAIHVKEWDLDLLLHNGDAIAALHVLRGVLASSQEERSHDIGGMSIETTDTSCHRTANQVLADV
jgi:hypothetical protein